VSHGPLTLSLVVPAYNQRARSVRAAATAAEFLAARFGERAELIVVDDGSIPAQALKPHDLPPRAVLVRHEHNHGKGGAVRSGVTQARGAYIVFTDSDLPFGLEPLETTLAWLADDADIVIGDRLHPDSHAEIDVTPTRQLSSVIYTWMVNRLCGLPYPDTQCGSKGYRSPIAKALFARLEVTSFAFEVEVLLRAHAAGYRIRRQPLRLLHDEDSSVRLTRHAPRMLIDVLRIAGNARRGRYDRRA
jgi:glycosyltransferase involved in cell wall biosynthesis